MEKLFSKKSAAASLSCALVVVLASLVRAAPPEYSDWSTPVNLGPTVNSPFSDQGPAVSKDGLSLYFGSNRTGGSGDFDIWVSQRPTIDSPWGQPVNLTMINTAAIENVPALSRDEHWLFFNSDRPGGFGSGDLWASFRFHTHDDFDWQPPINLGPGVNSAFFDGGATYFENDDVGIGLLYFGSNRPGGPGGIDIYVSAQLPDGSFGPASLVTELSSPQNDQRPAVRFYGLELFLFSDRVGTLGGNDLWVATRETVADAWSAPVNLGPTINGTSGEAQGYLASGRETLFFVSGRPGGVGSQDLYMTTRTKITGP